MSAKAFWAELPWFGLKVVAAFAWISLLIWLGGRYPPVIAYALAMIPLVLFLAVALAVHAGRRRRQRTRLLEEEWRR